jgi:hypothetical protein
MGRIGLAWLRRVGVVAGGTPAIPRRTDVFVRQAPLALHHPGRRCRVGGGCDLWDLPDGLRRTAFMGNGVCGVGCCGRDARVPMEDVFGRREPYLPCITEAVGGKLGVRWFGGTYRTACAVPLS